MASFLRPTFERFLARFGAFWLSFERFFRNDIENARSLNRMILSKNIEPTAELLTGISIFRWKYAILSIEIVKLNDFFNIRERMFVIIRKCTETFLVSVFSLLYSIK